MEKEFESQEQIPVESQEKTVSVDEMKRRLANKDEEYQRKLSEVQASMDEQIKNALEKYKAESELKGKELEEYKRQEAEREKEQLQSRIAELELEQTRRDLKDEAIKTLSERKMPLSDKILGFVVKDTAEATLSAIDDMADIIKDIKNEFASGRKPLSSGGSSEGQQGFNRADFFNAGNILKNKER